MKIETAPPPGDSAPVPVLQPARALFLWIAAPAMLLLCLLTGPFEAADEAAHFLRVVAISEGDLLPGVSPPDAPKEAAGAAVDAAAADLALASADITGFADHHYSLAELRRKGEARAGGGTKFAAHSNTAIYPPFLYAVSAFATVVARALDLPVLWWLYLGRLANTIVAIGIVQMSLRRAGDTGLGLLVIAGLPITLFQTASVSADALLFPLFIAYAVMLLRLARGDRTAPRETVALAATMVAICAGKLAYLPLALLPPVAARLGDGWWSRRAIALAASTAFTALVWLAWAYVVRDKVFSIRPNVTIDALAQLRGLLADPVAALGFFGHAMATLSPRLVIQAVGTKLGWTDLSMPAWLIYPLPFIAAAAALPAARPEYRRPFLTVAALVLALACYCAVFLLIYLQYNAVGAPTIVGVQGRYFTPLAILVLALLPRRRVSPNNMARIWAATSVIVLLSTITTLTWVWQRYW